MTGSVPRSAGGVMSRVVALLLALSPLPASAAELHVASSGGFAAAYKALAPEFEKRTGHTLVSVWGPSMGDTPEAIPNRLRHHHDIDVVIMVGDSLETLVRAGQVMDLDHRVLALSKIGLAVKAGAPHPDISTVAALKKVLLEAKSVAYSDSASGVFLSTVLFQRLGIADAMKDKARMIPAEPVGAVVARGEAEVGFQQISELLPLSGIDIVGPLPDEAQKVTPFSIGIVAGTRETRAAEDLIAFLSSPDAASLIIKSGLVPAPAAPR
ncbi:molybdate transport system substrate-binding protein [Nitrospirillum amazonense]|uniref:Molybdate transport system substrate-binding protein n=1 Tax=Nitrospirillum amazonense TaxID=28077 RepID=A0A560EWP4_9PROT|nr:substrate-binding domain-containing protein [Nitrospirillum amazonense]TWB13806.1 molybdate transport system substrate-binding protein [Nitrospirillum amazonense]